MCPAPKGSRNAAKKQDEIPVLLSAYIEHISKGFSKKSFPDCDHETIDKYFKDVNFAPLKDALKAAERKGRQFWEQMGQDITTGKIKGNAATWIFTMKNKYSDEWKDRMDVTSDDKPLYPSVDYSKLTDTEIETLAELSRKMRK